MADPRPLGAAPAAETPAAGVPGPSPEVTTTSVGVLVVAYEAAATIGEVLARIPDAVPGLDLRVLVADDASGDDTAAIARRFSDEHPADTWEVVRRDHNLGYGGNQKAGYRWAIGAGVEVVVLLHGDAQYQPEQIPDLVAPIADGRADAVLGSRMAEPGAARRGNMPLTRRIGNRVLSTVQNVLVGTEFSEWHSGYRAYRVATLAEVDLDTMPDGFDFDTALMLHLLRAGARYVEIPIPTRYADEKSRVKLFEFGLQVLRRTSVFWWEGRRRGGQAGRPASPQG